MQIIRQSNGFMARQGNLTGEAHFCDGVLYWGILGGEERWMYGERRIDQTAVEADSRAALRYAEVCLANAFARAEREHGGRRA